MPVCASMRIGEQLVLEVKCVSDPLRVLLKLTVFQLPQLQPVLLFLQDNESSAGNCCDHHHPNDKCVRIASHKRPKPVDNMIIDQPIYLLAPTGALILMMVRDISVAAPAFSDFHSVH